MADPRMISTTSGEHMFNQSPRRQARLCKKSMREPHEGVIGRFAGPDPREIAANRCSGNEAELVQRRGEALRDYAMSGKPAVGASASLGLRRRPVALGLHIARECGMGMRRGIP